MSFYVEGFNGRKDMRDPNKNFGENEHYVAFHIIYIWEDGIHTRAH